MVQKQANQLDRGITVIHLLKARHTRSLSRELVFPNRADIHFNIFLLAFVLVISHSFRNADFAYAKLAVVDRLLLMFDMENQRQHAGMRMLSQMPGIRHAVEVSIDVIACAFRPLRQDEISTMIFWLKFKGHGADV